MHFGRAGATELSEITEYKTMPLAYVRAANETFLAKCIDDTKYCICEEGNELTLH